MTGRDLLTLNLVDRRRLSLETLDDIGASPSRDEAFQGASGEPLFASSTDRTRPRRLRWFGASLALQGLVLGVWLLRSVTAESELPPPRVVQTFLTVAPVVPAPPPPPPSPSAASRRAEDTARRRVAAPRVRLADLAPVTMPLALAPLSDVDDTGFGVEGGVAGGVPGGIIGGLVGGLVEPQAPSEPTIYVVAGDLEPPDKLVHVDPVYPAIASAARVEGIVILEAVIDGEGNVEDVRILRSIPLLDDAALDAVRRWKYEPTVIRGKPVPIQMTVTVKFALA